MLAAWSKEEDPDCEEINLKALDLDENENYVDCGEINVKKIHSLFSEAYYDSRKFETETEAEAEAEEEEKDGEKEDGKILCWLKMKKMRIRWMAFCVS